MGNARRAAMQLLDTEWRRRVWKHWLANIFVPPVEPTAVANISNPSPQSSPAQPTTASASAAANAPANAQTPATHSPAARPERALTSRERLESISDRLVAIEGRLGTVLRGVARQNNVLHRGEHALRLVEQLSEVAERQTLTLEQLLNALTRLESALPRLEHRVMHLERTLVRRTTTQAPPRESYFPARQGWMPPQGAGLRQGSVSAEIASAVPSARSDRCSEAPEREGELDEESSFNGHLAEVSLSTILAMLEIERHTGCLKVTSDEGETASFELCEGNIISAQRSGRFEDPLLALRVALCWRRGRFQFRQQSPEAPLSAPRSIGSLLLEATRQNDESFADVLATDQEASLRNVATG